MNHLPFPSNKNIEPMPNFTDKQSMEMPWKRSSLTEPPPMMFQVQFRNGNIISYAYADLRETRLRDAGYLQLCILGIEKYHLTIEGRNLVELANLLGIGKIKSLEELGTGRFDRPESAPSIDSIKIETLTGPAY